MGTRAAATDDLVRAPDGLRLQLAPDVQAPRRARHAVAGLPLVADHDAETVKLLVTELVTNSVRHARLPAGRPILLDVRRRGTVLRVAVSDGGPGFEHEPGQPLPLAPGGRGLLLVERLSDRWGVTRGRGTCVWFELDVEDAEPAS